MKRISDPIKLFESIRNIIEESRKRVAFTVNSELTVLYWKVGQLIAENILNKSRAGYGEEIIENLSKSLLNHFGKGWSKQQLWNCIRTAEIFADEKILYALSRELSWTHIRILIFIDNDVKREFYMQMCRIEKWSTRQLSERIDSMLFERTAISKKPDKLVHQELTELSNKNKLTPDLVFKDPYFLDFLGLTDTFSEKDLESAIIVSIQQFLLELGCDFAFVARQKRIVIDNEDHFIDLLFFHRALNRLIAIDLKIGKFKAAYKGQMELYLKWIDKYERKVNEDTPLGLILCSELSPEKIELLELNNGQIRVASYLTTLPSKEILNQKLLLAIETAKSKIKD